MKQFIKRLFGKLKSTTVDVKNKTSKEMFADYNESLFKDLQKDPQKYWIDSGNRAYNPYR